VGTPDYLYYFALFFYLPLFFTAVTWIEEWGFYRTMIFVLTLQSFALWFGRTLNDEIFGTYLVGPTVGEILNSTA
jgi:hypothetical protein